MKLFILLVAVLNVRALAERRCPSVSFSDKYYDVEVIKEGLNNIHNIAINNNDNTVYFTFEDIDTAPNKVLGYMNLDTRNFSVIAGVKNASSIAIDQINNIVYVGGSKGLYLLNHNREPEILPPYKGIESLFFKNDLYYTSNLKSASRFEIGRDMPIRELEGVLVDDMALDDDNNIFYLQNETKIFRIKLGTKAINSYEIYTVNYLTTDIYYQPYILTDNGAYVYNKLTCDFDKVFNMTDLKAITFSKANEPIYVVNDLLVRLKLNPEPEPSNLTCT